MSLQLSNDTNKKANIIVSLFYLDILKTFRQRASTKWRNARLEQYKKILFTQVTVKKDGEKLLVPALEAFKESDTLVIVTT